ncbi:MAG: Co2+/Mg2+ efflux protein ApaG [Alphaproteobacteria bacterium]
MSNTCSETSHDITVAVMVEFLPEHSNPANHQYSWAYHITITNHRQDEVQLIKRHWQIIDARGNKEQVSGFGVVGEQPTIPPKGVYKYSSGCPLSTTSGMMFGHYQMIDSHSKMIMVTIPAFGLEIPNMKKNIH